MTFCERLINRKRWFWPSWIILGILYHWPQSTAITAQSVSIIRHWIGYVVICQSAHWKHRHRHRVSSVMYHKDPTFLRHTRHQLGTESIVCCESSIANDSQNFLSFKESEIGRDIEAVNRLEYCVAEIRVWVARNRLEMNDRKTESLVFTSLRLSSKFSVSQTNIVDCAVSSCHVTRNLGVAFDQELSMETHIENICRSAMAHLRNIIDIRGSLTQYGAEKLGHALLTSRIDNGKASLCGIPAALCWTRCNEFRTRQLVMYLAVENMRRWPRLSRDYTLTPNHTKDAQYIVLVPLMARRQTISGKFWWNTSQSGPWDTVSTSVSLYPEPRSSRMMTGYSLEWHQNYGTKLWNHLPVEIRVTTGLEKFNCTIKT